MLFRSPLQVQRQQAPQDGFVVGVGGVFLPAVAGPDGAVEGLVGVVEPGGTVAVEVGQGAFLELGVAGVFGVEPVLAQLVQPFCRRRDVLALLFGWPGNREGLEAIPSIVGWIVPYSVP
ncbi:MAG: hypothetical protein R3A46_18395 [Thermomicrobiales bacterium]